MLFFTKPSLKYSVRAYSELGTLRPISGFDGTISPERCHCAGVDQWEECGRPG